MEACQWGWFHPAWFFVLFIVFWIIVGRFWWGGRRSGWYRSPADHLNERYAKGEITKEEYEKIKSDLK